MEFCEIFHKRQWNFVSMLYLCLCKRDALKKNSMAIKRKIDRFLSDWRSCKGHLPLIVKGARHDITFGIKLCNKNIGFNGKFYTFPYS